MRTLKKLFANINYRNLLATIIGSAIVAFGTSIHVDSGAADGGIIGISRLIEHFTNGQVEIWFSSLVINIFCYVLAWRLMDARFVINMGVGTLTYSLFVKMFEPLHLDLGNYILLATFLGMLCIEIGTGLMLRYGSSPNGEYVLSMAVVKKGGFDFGWLHFLTDTVIILLFIPIADIESVIYALIFMTLTTPIVDYLVTAPKKSAIKTHASKKKGKWIPIIITGIVLVVLFTSVVIFLNTVSKADTKAINAYNKENIKNAETQVLSDHMIAYIPEGEIKAGLVFYPGGRVEYNSYEPLLKTCAQEGILCIVVEMPQNLAFFGINRGLKAIEHFPEIKDWYIGGHSLGGSMAATCAAANEGTFKGVILLGSYSVNNIKDHEVLTIYGSEDGVMNKNKYNKNKDNLPDNFTEVIIKGGNHAYFGMYGNQKNDGTATITNAEQIKQSAAYIVDFILN